MSFIMIEGELLNLNGISAVTPFGDGPGCTVQFTGGGSRYYPEHGPECFAEAIMSGNVVHYVDDDHEC